MAVGVDADRRPAHVGGAGRAPVRTGHVHRPAQGVVGRGRAGVTAVPVPVAEIAARHGPVLRHGLFFHLPHGVIVAVGQDDLAGAAALGLVLDGPAQAVEEPPALQIGGRAASRVVAPAGVQPPRRVVIAVRLAGPAGILHRGVAGQPGVHQPPPSVVLPPGVGAVVLVAHPLQLAGQPRAAGAVRFVDVIVLARLHQRHVAHRRPRYLDRERVMRGIVGRRRRLRQRGLADALRLPRVHVNPHGGVAAVRRAALLVAILVIAIARLGRVPGHIVFVLAAVEQALYGPQLTPCPQLRLVAVVGVIVVPGGRGLDPVVAAARVYAFRLQPVDEVDLLVVPGIVPAACGPIGVFGRGAVVLVDEGHVAVERRVVAVDRAALDVVEVLGLLGLAATPTTRLVEHAAPVDELHALRPGRRAVPAADPIGRLGMGVQRAAFVPDPGFQHLALLLVLLGYPVCIMELGLGLFDRHAGVLPILRRLYKAYELLEAIHIALFRLERIFQPAQAGGRIGGPLHISVGVVVFGRRERADVWVQCLAPHQLAQQPRQSPVLLVGARLLFAAYVRRAIVIVAGPGRVIKD